MISFFKALSECTRQHVKLGLTGLVLSATQITGHAELSGAGDSVVVVYNSSMPGSKSVADHYAERRQVPADQVLGLDLSQEETITREAFRSALYQPLFDFLKQRELIETEYEIIPATREQAGEVYENLKQSKVRYLVLCYGVPVRIAEDDNLTEDAEAGMRVELRRNQAAVDHELSWMGLDPKRVVLAGPIENPMFGTQKATELKPENGVMIVARLDGPSPEEAKGLVDKAIQAEEEGLWGRAYFDARGLKSGPYLQGDAWIRKAAQLAIQAGFEIVLDDKEPVFSPGFPMSHIAFYAGWYTADVAGPFTREDIEFMPGAIAYHLHSYSASKLRTTDRHWAGPLIHKGATATMGCVYEPYLGATPDISIFFERLLMGFSFGEAAYAAQRVLSWQTVVVGDPLYHPMSKPIQLLQMELTEDKNPLLAWLRVLAANQAIQQGAEKAAVVQALEKDTLSQTHPVLCEKLADLYFTLNRADDAKAAYERALRLDPTTPQRNRLLLALAELDRQAGKINASLDRMETMLQKDPTYPERKRLLQAMKTIAEQAQLTTKASEIAKRLDALGE